MSYKLGLAPLFEAWATRAQLKVASPDAVVTHGTLGAIGRGPWVHVHVFHGTMPAHSSRDRQGRKLRTWLIRGAIMGGICEYLSGLGALRVAVAKSVAREVRRFYFYRVHTVIENSVEIPAQPQAVSSRDGGVCFVGRPESRKGFATAVEVARRAGVELAVAGPDGGGDVRNLGLLSRGEVGELLSTSRAMLFPTRYEACSVAILEAVAHGCPVVTTRVGWMEDLIGAVPEYRLLIGSPDDVAKLTHNLVVAVEGGAQVQQAVDKARAYVATHNCPDTFADRWSRLLRYAALKDRSRGRYISWARGSGP
jgi:glycosyltransferase involved in cell wall biosynthesis